MLRDGLGPAVEVREAQEVSALGAALLAGVGVGVYDSLVEAVGSTVRAARVQQPDETRRVGAGLRYEQLTEAVRAVGQLDFGPGVAFTTNLPAAPA